MALFFVQKWYSPKLSENGAKEIALYMQKTSQNTIRTFMDESVHITFSANEPVIEKDCYKSYSVNGLKYNS